VIFLPPTNAVTENPRITIWPLLTQQVVTVSKYTKDAENVFALLVMVSIGALKRTLAGKTFHQNGLIDTSFDPPQFSLDSTFKGRITNAFPSFLVPPTAKKLVLRDLFLSHAVHNGQSVAKGRRNR
jgi:hypothetical protein